MALGFERYIPSAVRVERESGIPAPLILSQAILESGANLNSGLARNGNNLFGIKGSGTAGSIYMPTREYSGGKWITVNAPFRKYHTPEESMRDYARLLQRDRYQEHLRDARTLSDFTTGVWKGGYATDPKYPQKLNNIISQYRLDQIGSGYVFGSYERSLQNPIEGLTNLTNTNEGSGGGVVSRTVRSGSKFIIIIGLAIVALVFFVKSFEGIAKKGTNFALDAVGTVAKPVKGANEIRKTVQSVASTANKARKKK